MTEDQYRQLTRLCDDLLLAEDSSVERVAIPWLHVLREHPVILENYEDIFRSEPLRQAGDPGHRPAGLLGRLKAALRGLRDRLRGIVAGFREKAAGAFKADLPERVDFLFVSHLLNAGQVGDERDFYFDDTPVRLARKDYQVLIVLLNQTGLSAPEIPTEWTRQGVRRIILPPGGPQTARQRRRLAREARRLARRERGESDPLRGRVLRRAVTEAKSGSALAALSIGEAIGTIAGRTRARSILTTFEGHAWERIAFCAARKAQPAVRRIGYHQAFLSPLQHAMRRNLAPCYNPDAILTAGPVTRDDLARIAGVPVTVFGSDRGLADETVEPREPLERRALSVKTAPVCIVLPEGIDAECFVLFDFSLRCARRLTDVQFIWRLHPNLPLERLFDLRPEYKSLPANVTVGIRALEIDFARSQWALYRGTTAIFRAVLEGARPLYVGREAEMSIDPLNPLNAWKRVVQDEGQFERIIRQDREGSNPEDAAEFPEAFEFCKKYFAAYDPGALEAAAMSGANP